MLNKHLSDSIDLSHYSKEELLKVIQELKDAHKHHDLQMQDCASTKNKKNIEHKRAGNSGSALSEIEPTRLLESLSYAVNQVDENIFSLNADGQFLYANRQFLTEHRVKRVEGSSAIGILFSCRDHDDWVQLREKIRSSSGAHHYIIKRDDHEGNVLSYEVVVHHARQLNQEEVFWFFARNVTERLKQENKIHELNSLMDAILNNAPIYLFVKESVHFKYLYWNKALEEQMGIVSIDAVGKTDFDVFPDQHDAEKFRQDDLFLLRTRGKIELVEVLTNRVGLKRTVKTIKVLIERDGEAPLIIGVSLDITDLKMMEQQLIDAKHEAEQSNKLKSAFLANMSHEIRTPLNAIVGFAKLIMMEEDKDSQKEFVDIIDRNGDLLLQLINDILDLSKIEAGTLDFTIKKFSLDELCSDMYEVHRMKVQGGVSLIYEPDDKSVVVHSDRNRLAQVFTNLLSNAVKFTLSGEIRFGYSVKNGQIEMYVRDTGMGISREKLPNIFERFVKLNTFVQGTGLGLSITQTIIERLNGTISVSSELGKGTEFIFSIPYDGSTLSSTLDHPMQEKEVEILPKTSTRINKTILVVEDNESNYQLIKKYLGDKYEHFRANNGKEAVEMFRTQEPGLILMDIKLPVMDGLEATKIIRSLSQDVPIAAISAFAFDSDKEEMLEVGCNHFFSKPVSFDQLQSLFDLYLK